MNGIVVLTAPMARYVLFDGGLDQVQDFLLAVCEFEGVHLEILGELNRALAAAEV